MRFATPAKLLLSIVLLGAFAHAQTAAKYHSGRLLQMESVQCVVAETQKASSSAASMVPCQEYVLEGDGVLFHFRARDTKHAVLLPVGQTVEYRIVEGHFYVRAGAHDREFTIVAMEPREQHPPSVKSAQKINHLQ